MAIEVTVAGWFLVTDINSPFYGWVAQILKESDLDERHTRHMRAEKYFTCLAQPNTESQQFLYLTFNSNQLKKLDEYEREQFEKTKSRI